MTPAIKTQNLTKKYKNITAVTNLNLEIEKGELFGLLGINGAGKTTTLRMLTCLIKPTEGHAFINGYDVENDSGKVKKIIGVSPQETAIAPKLTVEENLKFFCGVYGINKINANEKTESLLNEFNLQKYKNKKAEKLSGGLKRRLSIAIALIGEPEVIFLDEPSLGLDVIARSDLWDTIRKLKKNHTIVLTTHYMEEAESLCDRLGIMKDGKLIITGTAAEIINKTGENTFVDAFISIVKEGTNEI